MLELELLSTYENASFIYLRLLVAISVYVAYHLMLMLPASSQAMIQRLLNIDHVEVANGRETGTAVHNSRGITLLIPGQRAPSEEAFEHLHFLPCSDLVVQFVLIPA